MNFDTKIAIVVAEDLAVWQKLNVTAFLTSGIIGATDGMIGEVYAENCKGCQTPRLTLATPNTVNMTASFTSQSD